MNRSFYGAEPTAYFRDRLTMLGLRAAKGSELAELVAGGVEWGQLRISRVGPELSDEEGQARTDRFVITESQLLLHHVSESLIRMFLAHSGGPECPWMELSALRLPGVFPAKVKALAANVWPREIEEDVAIVFMRGIPQDPDDEWNESRDAGVRLVRLLARRLLEDGDLYNSAKHGMTVIPGHGSFNLLTEEGEPVMGSNGTQIMYLVREKVSKTEVDWHEKTQWLNPEEAAWLTEMAICQLEALWEVARWRYLDEPLDGMRLVSNEAIDTAITKFPKPGPVLNFKRRLFRELL